MEVNMLQSIFLIVLGITLGIIVVSYAKFITDKNLMIKKLEEENKNLIKKVVTIEYEIKKNQKSKSK